VSEIMLYDVALAAVAEARNVDEALKVRNMAQRAKLYARQAKNRDMLADAAEIQLRAERKLGEIIVAAKEHGHLKVGRPKASNLAAADREEGLDQVADVLGEDDEDNCSDTEQFTGPVRLDEIGVDRKLSSTSQRWAALGSDDFAAKLQDTRDKILSSGAAVINPLKDLGTAEKKARRADREAELGARQAALPDRRYGVILADPEWRFEVRSEGGLDRSADNHYPTSALEAIKARDVASIAADDAVLFLWATVPMLAQGLEVLAAWGFAYKSHFVWVKPRVGTGYWNRNSHELLLVGTRGNPPAPAPGTQWDSAIEAPIGRHSQKPADFYRLIEAYFPTLPKIELNARAARAGWDAWGNEAPDSSQPIVVPDVSANGGGGDVSATPSGEAAFAIGALPADPDAQPAGADGAGQPGDAARPAGPPFDGRFTREHDAILRRYYAADVLDLAACAAEIGCTKKQARDRAKAKKLGGRDNQRRAVAEANRRRAGEVRQ